MQIGDVVLRKVYRGDTSLRWLNVVTFASPDSDYYEGCQMIVDTEPGKRGPLIGVASLSAFGAEDVIVIGHLDAAIAAVAEAK